MDSPSQIVVRYALNNAYPNQFNPSTTISYSIPEDSRVKLCIYDILGKEVAVLEDGFKSGGNYSHIFDASNLASGIYFYGLRANDFSEIKKMLQRKYYVKLHFI